MVRTSLALLVVVACARSPEAAPATSRDAAPPHDVSAPPPDAARDAAHDLPAACPWSWPDDTDLSLPAAPEGMPSGWDVACAAGELVVAARTGTHLAVARRALEPASRWGDAVAVADDVLSLGRAGVAGGRAWVPWVSTRRGLRAVRVARELQATEPAMPAPFGSFAAPALLGGEGDAALVLARYHRLGADRLVLMRVGFDRPAVGAALGTGEVQAVRSGDSPVALVMAREPAAQGHATAMRAHRVDVRAALAMAGGPAPGHLGALPEGSVRVGEALAVGRGRFEVSPIAPGADAVLLQTAIGAERGTVRVAWFRDAGAPESVTLPFAAQALGAAVDDGGRAVWITWWDDHNVPRRARVTAEGMGEAEATGPAESSARVAQQVARDARTVWCGAAPWTVQARTEAGRVRFRARAFGCEGALTPR